MAQAEQTIRRIYNDVIKDPAVRRINFEYRGLPINHSELEYVHRHTSFSVTTGSRAAYYAQNDSLEIPVAYYERWGAGSIRNIAVHELVHGIQDKYPRVTNGWRIWEIELTAMLAQAIVQLLHNGRSTDPPFPALYRLLESRSYNGGTYFDLQNQAVRYSQGHLEAAKNQLRQRRLPDGSPAYPNMNEVYRHADGIRCRGCG